MDRARAGDDKVRLVTVESEMERLTVHGRYDVTLTIVNAGQEGAQFFAAQIRESAVFAAVDGRIATTYGYGTGPDCLTALSKAERVALDQVVPGYEAIR